MHLMMDDNNKTNLKAMFQKTDGSTDSSNHDGGLTSCYRGAIHFRLIALPPLPGLYPVGRAGSTQLFELHNVRSQCE